MIVTEMVSCAIAVSNQNPASTTPSVMTKFMPAFLLKCARSQANERLTVGSVPSRVRPESAGEVEATSIPALLEREDCTLVAWYPSLYAPRTGGAYDSHHRTAGIAGRTRRRGGGVAAHCGCAAARAHAARRRAHALGRGRSGRTKPCCRVSSRSTGGWLGSWPQCQHRRAMGGG